MPPRGSRAAWHPRRTATLSSLAITAVRAWPKYLALTVLQGRASTKQQGNHASGCFSSRNTQFERITPKFWLSCKPVRQACDGLAVANRSLARLVLQHCDIGQYCSPKCGSKCYSNFMCRRSRHCRSRTTHVHHASSLAQTGGSLKRGKTGDGPQVAHKK